MTYPTSHYRLSRQQHQDLCDVRDMLSVLKELSSEREEPVLELSMAGVGATFANLHDRLAATLASVETSRAAAVKKYYAEIERQNDAHSDRILGKDPSSDPD